MLTSKRKDRRTKTVMTVWKKAVSHQAQSSNKSTFVRYFQQKFVSAVLFWFFFCLFFLPKRQKSQTKQNTRALIKSLNRMTSHHTHCTCVCDYVSVCGVTGWIPPLRFSSQIKALKVNRALPEKLVYQICNCTHTAKWPSITYPAWN